MTQQTYTVICPNCDEQIWDLAYGHKLHKCWSCMQAYDSWSVKLRDKCGNDTYLDCIDE